MIEEYKTIAADMIALAKKLGAEQVSVSLANATAFQLEVLGQRIDALKEAVSSGIHLTISRKQRRSTVSSNDFRMETLEPLIRSTLEALPHMGEDPYFTLPDPDLQGRASGDLRLIDSEFEAETSAEKVEGLLKLEEEALNHDPRLSTEEAYYSDSISHTVHGDTNGFMEGCTKTLFSKGISMVADDETPSAEGVPESWNTGRKQTDGWHTSARFRKNLSPNSELAGEAGKRTLRKLGAVKPKSCEVSVVFSAEMAQSFLGSLASAMMGENVFRKHSFLIDKLRLPIANQCLRLRDDPLIPGKLGSRHYDSEGVRARPLVLIENGILQHFMCSTYSANKLGMTSTGHAGGISNLLLVPGPYPEEELIASVREGLYLTSMSGQGVNITTGDYSRGGQGLWIRDGKLAEPVSEFTLAGTFMQMLKGISMIGSEVDERSTILAPAFKIDRMALSGS